MNIGVIELRNYLLKPGMRQAFYDYFNDHFIDSQEVLGGYVLAQYGVVNDDNRFYWIRGFENMNTRSHFLPAFYEGKIWEEYGPAANEMMLEWQDVYLLKTSSGRATPISAFEQWKGQLKIEHFSAGEHLPALKESINEKIMEMKGTPTTSLWISEMGTNHFAQLPVFQFEDLLTSITILKNEKDKQSITQHAAIPALLTHRKTLQLYSLP